MAITQTVTVVFTDLVGSTETSSRLGPEATESLRQTHFGLLRGAVQVTGGTEVKNLGDGLMVAFSSLSRALACAVSMQQAIERHNRRDQSMPLSVRIGISAGEATEEAGDYFGEPVVEAARLCAMAEGGQILATEVVKIMAGRHATQEFVSVGDVELKGIPEPVSTVEIVWEPDTSTQEDRSRLPLPARLVGASAESLFAFFGRSEELRRLGETQKGTATEHRLRVTFVSGEPGIGKTTLVAQAARAAHEAGASVLYGSCEEGLGVPYQPWIAALDRLVDYTDEADLRAFVKDNGPALARLVPGLARRLTLDLAPSDGDTERFLILEGVARFLALVSSTTPLVVVLDDLHWVDAGSLQLLRHLVTSATPMSVLVVGTFRESDLSRMHPLASALADLRRELAVDRMDLLGLEDNDIIDLLAAAAGHDMEDEGVALAHALRRETGGNPFFLVEVVRHLAESGALRQDDAGRWVLSTDLDELGLPSSVREVVAQRVARLGEEAERALSLAAVIGRDFDLELLARLVDTDEDHLLDLLDGAIAAGLISEPDGGAGQYRFHHVLIQHTLYQDLSPTRRQRAHRRVAELLEAGGVDDDRNAPELARHWMLATRPSDASKAVHYAQRAGDAALVAFAPQDAVKWYLQALELASQQAAPDDRTRCALLIGLGTAQRQAGQPEHRDTLREARLLARQLAESDLLVRVSLSRDPNVDVISEPDADRVAVMELALEAVGPSDSEARARLLAGLADEIDPREVSRRVAIASEAIDVARRLGDDRTLLSVLNMVATPLITPDTLERRLMETELALELSARTGDVAGRDAALSARFQVLLETGDLHGAEACLAEMEVIAEQTGIPYHRWNALVKQCWKHLNAGELSEAERGAEEVLALGTAIGLGLAAATYGAFLFSIYLAQGRLADMIPLAEDTAAKFPTLPSWTLTLTPMYCEVGRLDEARRRIDAAIESEFSSLPFDITWLASMSALADSAADTGHADAARIIYEKLTPYMGRVMFNGASDGGAVDRPLGRLATLLGQFDEAEAHLSRALEIHELLHAPYWIARTQLDQVELMVNRHNSADLGSAGDLVQVVQRRAAHFGFRGLLPRVDRLLQQI